MPIKWIKYLPHLVIAILLAATLWLAYRSGFQTAYHEQQLVIDQAEKDKNAALLASANAYAEQLKQVQQAKDDQTAKTQAVGTQLARAQANVYRLKQQRKTGINHAIEQDKTDIGECINGFGPNSLRQYRRALGYAD